jgi:hypothetical protein
MTISISTDDKSYPEQTYSHQNGVRILDAIGIILKQDRVNLFKLKSTVDIDSKIEQSNRDIEKQINLRTQNMERKEKLTAQVNDLKSKNQQRIAVIGGILDVN